MAKIAAQVASTDFMGYAAAARDRLGTMATGVPG